MIKRLGVMLLAPILTCSALAEPNAGLQGRVTAGGKPVTGATVMVNRAWPLKGLAYYCPGCYRDCGKSAVTDAAGDWTIPQLDDTLKFELLVVAKGCIPTTTKPIDPTSKPTVAVEVTARDTDALPANQVVRGRVLDLAGEPLKGAVVSPETVWHSDGSGCSGACPGLDSLAVTDEDGRFALAYDRACTAMDLAVSARGFAQTCFPRKAPGATIHELRVTEGAGVSGKLMRNGIPVSDVEITLVADQSRGRVCYDRQTIATDRDGAFLFAGVLPGQSYVLTASTDQLREGCVAPKSLRVEDGAPEVNVGELNVIRGVRLSGRVLAPKDGALPAGAKLSLSSALGWDGVTVDLAPDGSFAFREVAQGAYSIHLTAPGVYVSHRNPSADKLNENTLWGRLDSDIAGLQIETTTVKPKPPRRDSGEAPELGGIETKNE